MLLTAASNSARTSSSYAWTSKVKGAAPKLTDISSCLECRPMVGKKEAPLLSAAAAAAAAPAAEPPPMSAAVEE
jgi:hypothetical protein